MTTLLIIIVLIQIILYCIMLWSLRKHTQLEIELFKQRQKEYNSQYKEYQEWRRKVWDLLNKNSHPVMIGDVLDWIDKLNQGLGEDHIKVGNSVRHKFDTKIKIIEDKRKELRKPISYQSDSCVDYIYSLIQQVKG